VLHFVECLAEDIRFVGMKPRMAKRDGKMQLDYVARNISPSDHVKIARMIRSRQISKQRAFIRAFERSSGGVPFVAGKELQLKRIKPKLHICRTPADLAIHRYCRLTQTVPSGPRVGRRIAALVYDVGQRRPVLMGAITLASPLYSVRARDEFFAWGRSKRIKAVGLRRVMDVSLCMALPPYNFILTGKLIAMLAASETLSNEFRRRYHDRLLALTTTCATGLHCPIFNRIMIRRGGLYRRIGETTGYTGMIFSDDTVSAARRLIQARRLAEECSMWNTTRILKTAMTYCGIKPGPLFGIGNRKGVYIALLDKRSLDRLRTGRSLQRRDMITDANAIDFWKANILPRRLRDPQVVGKIHSYKFRRLRIPRTN
jgi:hypothetical protein